MYNREKIMSVMGEIVAEAENNAPYVVIAQPRRDNSAPAQLLNGMKGMHVDTCGYSHAYCDCVGEKVDVARNYLMEQCAASRAKYMLFVGEDTVLPAYAFHQLHATAEANPGSVVAGVYYVKLSSAMVMVRTPDGHVVPADVTPGQIIHNVHLIGMDAMLIPLKILRDMMTEEPELPFCCIYAGDEEGNNSVGEDNFFTYRLRKRGVDIICDTNVQCLHVDLELWKYTAHPDIKECDYYTNQPLMGRLTMADKRIIDMRWFARLPEGSGPKMEIYNG
jgi:hypothetical protein